MNSNHENAGINTINKNNNNKNLHLRLVGDSPLSPEGVAVVHVEGRGKHGHPHAEPGRLQGRGGAGYAAADNEQIGVETAAAARDARPRRRGAQEPPVTVGDAVPAVAAPATSGRAAEQHR